MSSKLGKLAKNYIPPLTPTIGGHNCQFPEVTKKLLATLYAYQKMFVLMEMRINRLENLISQDLGYTEAEMSAMLTEDNAINEATDDITKLLDDFLNGETTVKAVKNDMKGLGFPVEKWSD